MNEDKIVGGAQELLGRGERAVGGAVGSDRIEAEGVLDQVKGTVRQGYGEVKDAVASVVAGTPGAVSDAAERTRRLAVRADDALYDRLGENRHYYVLAGAVAVLAVAILYAGRDR